MSRPLVSVVIPLFNEASTLPELVERLNAVAAQLGDRYVFDFVFVDDFSRDDTLQVAERFAIRDPRIQVIALKRNYGQTAALQVGFEHATGAIVVSMDGDLQHFPEDIPALLEQIEAGYDVVCGWRFPRLEGPIRRWPSSVANWIIRKLTGLTIHDIGTTFRAYRADIVPQLQLLGENHRFIPAIAAARGAQLTEVKIRNIERPQGVSNYGLSRTFNVLLDIFFIVFYMKYLDRPMRVFGRIAIALMAAATIIALGLAYLYVAFDVSVVRERSGWFMLSLVLYVAGVQFLLFGLMSEVLVRLYFYPGQVKPYLVRRIIRAGGPASHSPSPTPHSPPPTT